MSPEQLSRKWSNCPWSNYRRSIFRRSNNRQRYCRRSNCRCSTYRRSNSRRSKFRRSNCHIAFVAEQLSRSNCRLQRSTCHRSKYRRSICRTFDSSPTCTGYVNYNLDYLCSVDPSRLAHCIPQHIVAEGILPLRCHKLNRWHSDI